MAARRLISWHLACTVFATLLVPAAASAAPSPEVQTGSVIQPSARVSRQAHLVSSNRYLDVAITSTGKRLFLAVGRVERVRTNGRFDASFGEEGVATVPTLTGTGTGAMALDGRGVLVAGSVGDSGGVVRLRSDGSVDNSFGADGAAILSIPDSVVAIGDISLDRTGRIVVSGTVQSTGDKRAFLARFTDDGELDPTFSADGLATLAVDGDDTFVLATGSHYVAAVTKWSDRTSSIIRVTADGELDPTFGTNGVSPVDAGGPTSVTGLGATTGGRVAVGVEKFGVVGVAVFGGSGDLDTGFSEDGLALFATPPAREVDGGLVTRSDGRLLVASVESNVARIIGLLPDGRLDPAVGRRGWAASTEWPLGGEYGTELRALAVDQTSNTVELAGWREEDMGLESAIRSRISLDSTPLPDFATSDSTATYGATDRVEVAGSIVDTAVRSSGKLVVLAQRSKGPYRTFAVEKRFRTGRLDPTFADKGTYTFRTSSGLTVPLAVAIQDTSILVAYAEYGGDDPQIVLTRLTADGALDRTFGSQGRRTIPSSGLFMVSDLIVDPAGRVVVAGLERPSAGAWDAGVVRLRPNGRLDGSFGTGGTARVAIRGGSFPEVSAVVRHGRGYVVTLTDNDRLRVVRFDDAGTIDPDFDGTGAPRYRPGAFQDLAAAPSDSASGGRIVIGLDSRRGGVLWSLDASGSPVDEFGTGGRLAGHEAVSTVLTVRADGRTVFTWLRETTDSFPHEFSVVTTTYRRDGSVDPANPTTTVPVPRLEPVGKLELVDVPAGTPAPFYIVVRTGLGRSDLIIRSSSG